MNVEGTLLTKQGIEVLKQLDRAGVCVIATSRFSGIIKRSTTITLTDSSTHTVTLNENPITGAQTMRVYPTDPETPSIEILRTATLSVLYTVPVDGSPYYDIPLPQTNYVLANAATLRIDGETGDLANIANGTTIYDPVRVVATYTNPNYEAALKANLFITEPREVYLDELERVQRLDLSSSNIADLFGLSDATSLRYLDVSFNPLVDAGPFGNESLVTVNAGYALTEGTFLDALPNLELVNIAGLESGGTVPEVTTFFDGDFVDLTIYALDPADLEPSGVGATYDVNVFTDYTDGIFKVFVRPEDALLPDLALFAGEDCPNEDEVLIQFEHFANTLQSATYTAVSNVVTITHAAHGLS